MRTFGDCQARWRCEAERVANTGYYADPRRAEMFVARHVIPLWAPALESTREEVRREFRITPTQVRVVHLFARAVIGAAGGKAPRFRCFPPSYQRRTDGTPICYRVVPVSDIARIVGACHSAVDRALARFKGKGAPAGLSFPKYSVCNVISIESGVTLDGLFDRQTAFPFAYAVTKYEHAHNYVREARAAHRQFVERQRAWCKSALASNHVVPLDAKALKAAAEGRSTEQRRLGSTG